MSSDPVARSDIWAGAPNEAEYDAVYAAVMATERGRWFLTEYASRNRHANTQALLGAMARVEVAIRGDGATHSPVSLGRDFIEMAAAIDRIRAAIGTERTPAPDIAAAAERIQDIAFTLRERAADAMLCDALDAAAREICDACAQSDAGEERAHTVTKLLRDLAGRLDEMALSVADDVASKGAGPPAAADVANGRQPAVNNDAGVAEAEIDDDSLSQADLFSMDVRKNEKFAQAIAALAGSLSSLSDEPGKAIEAQSEPANAVLAAPDYEEPPPNELANRRPRWYIEPPEFEFHAIDREPEKQRVETSGENGHTRSLLPETRLLPGPQDDPADLFEPPAAAAITPSVITPSVITPAVITPAVISPAVIAPVPAVRAMPSPPPPDPLAGIRALSEEEVIALFS